MLKIFEIQINLIRYDKPLNINTRHGEILNNKLIVVFMKIIVLIGIIPTFSDYMYYIYYIIFILYTIRELGSWKVNYDFKIYCKIKAEEILHTNTIVITANNYNII